MIVVVLSSAAAVLSAVAATAYFYLGMWVVGGIWSLSTLAWLATVYFNVKLAGYRR